MSTVIEVNGVGKCFSISHEGEGARYTALRDVIAGKVKRVVSSEARQRQREQSREDFWALRELNFKIEQGDRVGIIGRNGAGKSTLLKILSRITTPTKGEIKIRGRVASLLEVGTGFHPELTGRENIYLNGAILGMSRSEIRSKFDEIVNFAEVERFLDTPVKRYSSGMYVRLAFAVAAHLEPEILIVDEVLAVGDAQFQRKCLGKMNEVSQGQGRTVLYVSHNMASVKTLCNRGIVLSQGTLAFAGDQIDAVKFYQSQDNQGSSFFHQGPPETAPGNKEIRILEFDVRPETGDMLTMRSGVNFHLKFYNYTPDANIDITFEVTTQDDIMVFHNGTVITHHKDSKTGEYTVLCRLPTQLLNAGVYSVNLLFGESQRRVLYKVNEFSTFEVMQETTGSNSSKLPGIVFPPLTFDITAP